MKKCQVFKRRLHTIPLEGATLQARTKVTCTNSYTHDAVSHRPHHVTLINKALQSAHCYPLEMCHSIEMEQRKKKKKKRQDYSCERDLYIGCRIREDRKRMPIVDATWGKECVSPRFPCMVKQDSSIYPVWSSTEKLEIFVWQNTF